MVEQARREIEQALAADDDTERDAALQRALERLEEHSGTTQPTPGSPSERRDGPVRDASARTPDPEPTTADDGPGERRDDTTDSSERPLAAIAHAREQLEAVPLGALDEPQAGRLLTALERLDNILLNADFREVAAQLESSAADGVPRCGCDD